jgi:hypothetical protein
LRETIQTQGPSDGHTRASLFPSVPIFVFIDFFGPGAGRRFLRDLAAFAGTEVSQIPAEFLIGIPGRPGSFVVGFALLPGPWPAMHRPMSHHPNRDFVFLGIDEFFEDLAG